REPGAPARRAVAAGAGLLHAADPAGRTRRPPRHRPDRARTRRAGDGDGVSLTASAFDPPGWLRSPHLQSVLASRPLRGARARLRLRQAPATHEAMVLDAGDGVRLQGIASLPIGSEPRALALLLHGWEGSAESSYMRLTAARLLRAGFAVFRLDFRDHGGSHHLNEGLFHSNRLDEVVGAAAAVARRWP